MHAIKNLRRAILNYLTMATAMMLVQAMFEFKFTVNVDVWQTHFFNVDLNFTQTGHEF
jgi:hypothetical protein